MRLPPPLRVGENRIVGDEVARGDWDEVLERLGRARAYWLATTSPARGPHVAPVWGVVHQDALHVYTARSTVKARNVAADPRVAVHLEDASNVTIVYGTLEDLGNPRDNGGALAALDAKYDRPGEADYLPSAPGSGYDVLYRLHPERALAWDLDDFDESQRRWGE